jgi:uridine kinase
MSALVGRVASAVDELLRVRARVLVGIDGPDAAGKTVFADRLSDKLGGDAVRASTDAFHNPVAVRRRRGEFSPEGYYRDAFDYVAIVDELLEPFRAGRTRVGTCRYDYGTEEPIHVDVAVPTRSVLLFDGVFLLRRELRQYWTLCVYLSVSPEESLRRGVERDAKLFGSEADAARRYAARYLPAQALYRAEVDPERLANIVVDNTEPADTLLLRWSPPRSP